MNTDRPAQEFIGIRHSELDTRAPVTFGWPWTTRRSVAAFGFSNGRTSRVGECYRCVQPGWIDAESLSPSHLNRGSSCRL